MTSKQARYAILDTDGPRLVVWGIGHTSIEARIEAEEQESYIETEHNRWVEITPEHVARIERGIVSAKALGLED